MKRVTLGAVLRELKRRGIRFGEEFPDRGMFITREGVNYAISVKDDIDDFFKYTLFDRGKSKEYAFIIYNGLQSNNPKIRHLCEVIKKDIDTCVKTAEQLKRYAEVKYQKAIQEWNKKFPRVKNSLSNKTNRKNLSFALDENQYLDKAAEYANIVDKKFDRRDIKNSWCWHTIAVEGRKCQDSRMREMATKIFNTFGHAQIVWDQLYGILTAKR